MPATTIQTIVDRLRAILEASPYGFKAAAEPFGFDLQPDTRIDGVYAILAEDTGQITGYFNMAQAQIDRVTIRIARKTRQDPQAAVDLLVADATALQSSIIRDGQAADYSGEVESWRVPPPRLKDNFAIAEIVVTVDYDREL